MKAYVLSVAGTAILTAIITLISPGKKYAKTVEGVLKMCMLLALVAPVFQLFRGNTTNFFQSESIYTQDVAYINNSYQRAFEKYLKENFGVTASVTVETDELRFKKILVYISDFGMNEKEEHINIVNRTKEAIEKISDCKDVEVSALEME